jgi:hypothetical protein
MAGPHLGGASAATAQQRHLNARLLEQTDSQPVAYIEALEQLPLRPLPEPTIAEDPIDIQHQ